MTLYSFLLAVGIGMSWTCVYQSSKPFDYKTKLFKDWIMPTSLVAAFVSFVVWFPGSQTAKKIIEYTTTTHLW